MFQANEHEILLILSNIELCGLMRHKLESVEEKTCQTTPLSGGGGVGGDLDDISKLFL